MHFGGVSVLIFSLLIVPAEAHAYLDPGTGSLILQAILAGIFSALFFIKMFWRRIKLFFSNLFSGKSKDHDTP